MPEFLPQTPRAHPRRRTYKEALSPIHHMFPPFRSRMVGNFKFPIRPKNRKPIGCSPTLVYQERNVIHEFLDRVLCYSQLLYEKYGVKAYFITFLDGTPECCAVCKVTAPYFLPALVAPYFVLRQHRRAGPGGHGIHIGNIITWVVIVV